MTVIMMAAAQLHHFQISTLKIFSTRILLHKVYFAKCFAKLYSDEVFHKVNLQ